MKSVELSEEKRRYSGRTVIQLGRYMLQYKWMLALAFVCTLGSNLFSLSGPKLTGLCIGAVEPGRGGVDKVIFDQGKSKMDWLLHVSLRSSFQTCRFR